MAIISGISGDGPPVTITDALFVPLLRRDAAAPRVTYYDDATGERIELSGATLANWVAKSANLLRDECELEPGGRVAVLLPAHWQTMAVLLATWWCGGQVVADAGEADIVLTDVDHLDVALATAAGSGAVIVGLSLDAFGRGLTDAPVGVIDYATDVRLQGDDFIPGTTLPDSAPALVRATTAEVLAGAAARAAELGLTDGDRVLSTLEWPVPDGVVDGLLAVLAVGGSLVQCRNVDPGTLERRAQTERTTARLG